jgi:plasmid stabilization system protein ParE
MSLRIFFQPEAHLEFDEAVAWYETQHPGLGRKFKLEVKSTLERTLANPGRFQHVRGRAQKIRLRHFKKYAIYFAIKDDVFSVIAVFHGSRNPAKLGRRLP